MNGEHLRDPAEHRNPDAAGTEAVKGRVPAVLLLVFCCWHAGFLIFSILPRQPGQENPGNPAMDLYRLLTGGRQVWNVFQTIPPLHAFDARVEVKDETGARTTTGCVLPDLAPYPKPERSRYFVLFHRLLLTSSKHTFFDAYLRKLENRLSSQRGSGIIGRWSLVIDTEYTRTLIYSRGDGVLSVFATRSFNPANPGGISQ